MKSFKETFCKDSYRRWYRRLSSDFLGYWCFNVLMKRLQTTLLIALT
jgi:hypothetical protein